ncbi:hypothetical protein Trydic_g23910, partial [Trypoxylus dichotomus]
MREIRQKIAGRSGSSSNGKEETDDLDGDRGHGKAYAVHLERSLETPDNVDAVRAVIQQSLKRFAHKLVTTLGISNRCLRRILNVELKLYPYKTVLAQELSESNHVNHRIISTEILEQVPADAIV